MYVIYERYRKLLDSMAFILRNPTDFGAYLDLGNRQIDSLGVDRLKNRLVNSLINLVI